MNVTEANDLSTLLRWLGAHPLDDRLVGVPVDEERAAEAFARLTARAGKALQVPARDLDIGSAFERLHRRVTEHASDAAAQGVCEVLATHLDRGLALIQWSTFAAEFRRWQQLQETTS